MWPDTNADGGTYPLKILSCSWHRDFLAADARAQFSFFENALWDAPGFANLDHAGHPSGDPVRELHATTRMVHAFALGKLAGRAGCDRIIDHGMQYLLHHHQDPDHGGFVWSLNDDGVADGRKLAYGHVFVLLAASSALAAGHPDAPKLFEAVDTVLDAHFWEEDPGLFCDEYNRDWTPFSTYRGMNANMHGVEALLAAFEVTGREIYLQRADSILQFFIGKMAPLHDWRLPEHYTQNWEPDPSYSGDPMFRPAGTTPGHSLELGRLLLQFNELAEQKQDRRVDQARSLMQRALQDAWDRQNGGLIYTLNYDGTPAIRDRYWWPVSEAIGAMAALLKTAPRSSDADWYQQLWTFAHGNFIDRRHGGWFPEIDALGRINCRQFSGKPDIYHAVQAALFPLTPKVSGIYRDIAGTLAEPA